MIAGKESGEARPLQFLLVISNHLECRSADGYEVGQPRDAAFECQHFREMRVVALADDGADWQFVLVEISCE